MTLNYGSDLFRGGELLVNYDWIDIADGLGYVEYYGAVGDNGELLVTPKVLYSEEICKFIASQTVGETPAKYFDLDFDLTFNLPKNVYGKIYVNVPIGASATSTNTDGMNYYVICKAYHYDGTTETLLGTGTSRTAGTNIATGAVSYTSMTALCICDVASITHFKKGETLRITVEGWFSIDSGTVSADLMIGTDPMNREFKDESRDAKDATMGLANEAVGGGTVTYQNTKMIFQVPYRLEV